MFDQLSVGEGIVRRKQPLWLRYGIALFAVAVATAVRAAFQILGNASLPYISFYPAVILVALFMGRGPGLVAVALSALAATYWIEPVGTLWISSPAQMMGMALFVSVNLLIVWVCDGLRSTLRRAIQAERALREAYRKETLALLESINDGFVALDRDWRFVSANSAAARLVRIPREELLGKVLWDIFPEADRLLFGSEYRRAVKENVALTIEEFYPEPLNAWFEVRCYPSADGLSLFFTDVTERKAKEQRLRQLSRAVNQSPSAVVITDTKGNIEYVNPKFTAITGYSAEEAIGKNPHILKTDETPRETYTDMWQTIAAGREWRGEFHNRKKNGELFWEAASISAITDEDGAITHYVAVKEDITESKAAQIALLEAKRSAEEARHSAEQANQAKDGFIATLSHELRTPLTPVLMAASGLELDETLQPEARSQISLIRHNVELEARLIDDLLDITKITHGKFSVRKESVSVREILARTVEVVRADFVLKGITVQIDPVAETVCVNADPARLQQVLWNLLKNAIKFTPAGGSVHVRTFHPEPGVIAIEVSDTGVGIPSESLEEIFLPFHQASATGKHRYGGLGLGLAISKAIVEVHGGHIAAANGTKGGAMFTVRLPLDPTEDKPAGESTTVAQGAAPLRILLVEDHDHTRAVLACLLTRDGHLVEAVNSCAAALKAAHNQSTTEPFQTLISDLGLPDGTGFDLVRELKIANPKLRAIALSGYGSDEDFRKSTNAGFARHFVKPINFQDLRRVLAE